MLTFFFCWVGRCFNLAWVILPSYLIKHLCNRKIWKNVGRIFRKFHLNFQKCSHWMTKMLKCTQRVKLNRSIRNWKLIIRVMGVDFCSKPMTWWNMGLATFGTCWNFCNHTFRVIRQISERMPPQKASRWGLGCNFGGGIRARFARRYCLLFRKRQYNDYNALKTRSSRR